MTYLKNLTARPKSAMQHVPFFFTKMFLLFISLWAIAGFPETKNLTFYNIYNTGNWVWNTNHIQLNFNAKNWIHE